MGGLSLFHWIIILVILLIVMGPRRLPDLGKSLGEAIRGFKKGLEGNEIDVTNNSRRENLPPSDTTGSATQPPKDNKPPGQS